MKIIRMPVLAILILSSVPYLVACSSKTDSVSAITKDSSFSPGGSNDTSVADAGSVETGKTVDLPHYPPDFPPGKSRDLFVTRCGVCHSLRYVTMQPDFSRKTWGKEVDKMIKTYGAHINKKEAAEITEYLFSIKGKGDGSDKH